MGYDPEKGNANTSGNLPPKKDQTQTIKDLGKTAVKGTGK